MQIELLFQDQIFDLPISLQFSDGIFDLQIELLI